MKILSRQRQRKMQAKNAHYLISGNGRCKQGLFSRQLSQSDPHANSSINGQVSRQKDYKVAIETGISLTKKRQDGQVVAAKVLKMGSTPVPLQVKAQIAEGLLNLDVKDVKKSYSRRDDEDVGVCAVKKEEGKGKRV